MVSGDHFQQLGTSKRCPRTFRHAGVPRRDLQSAPRQEAAGSPECTSREWDLDPSGPRVRWRVGVPCPLWRPTGAARPGPTCKAAPPRQRLCCAAYSSASGVVFDSGHFTVAFALCKKAHPADAEHRECAVCMCPLLRVPVDGTARPLTRGCPACRHRSRAKPCNTCVQRGHGRSHAGEESREGTEVSAVETNGQRHPAGLSRTDSRREPHEADRPQVQTLCCTRNNQ